MKRILLFICSLVFPVLVHANGVIADADNDGFDDKWQETVRKNAMRARELYGPYIQKCFEKYNIHNHILLGILLAENAPLNPKAESVSKARGHWQMKEPTAQFVRNVYPEVELGDDLFDIETSTDLACHYLATIDKKFDGASSYHLIAGYYVGHNGIMSYTTDEAYFHRYTQKVRWVIRHIENTNTDE